MRSVTRACLSLLQQLLTLIRRGLGQSLGRLLSLLASLRRACARIQSKQRLQGSEDRPDLCSESSSVLPYHTKFRPNYDHTNDPSDKAIISLCEAPPTTPIPLYHRPRHGDRHPGSVDTTCSSLASPTDTVVGEASTIGSFLESAKDRYSYSSSFVTSTPNAVPPFRNVATPAGIICAPENDSFDHDNRVPELRPITPSQTGRFERKIKIKAIEQEWLIKPGVMEHLYPPELPLEWIVCTNPDGQLYFYISSGRRRYITDSYLYDGKILGKIQRCINSIDQEIDQHKTPLPDDFDVVLELLPAEDGESEDCGYYMVNHESRNPFWLHDFDASYMADEANGVASLHQLKQYFSHEYWLHKEQFPHVRELPEDALPELVGILLHGSIDSMTSLDSTMPYSVEECSQMLDYAKHMRSMVTPGIINPYVNAGVGRLMALFAHQRFMDFHGQHGARLCRDQSVRGETEKARSWLMIILSPLLFHAPDTHLRGLERIWVDKFIVQRPWKHFVDTLKEEWVEFILYATVLLNANVAFLAIPSVDDSNSRPSPSQIASLLSVINSLGSIILGLLLVRQHRTKAKETADEAAAYLLKRTHRTLGLETLSIMYSLPYALLMWAMVTFLAAIAFICFEATGLGQRLVIAATWLAVGVLIFWTIYTGWETSDASRMSLVIQFLRTQVIGVKEEPSEDVPEKKKRWRRFRERVARRRVFKRWHPSSSAIYSHDGIP